MVLKGIKLAAQDYYLQQLGIDQWILRTPIQRVYKNCLIQGPSRAKLLGYSYAVSSQDFILLEESSLNTSLLQSMLTALDISMSEFKWIQFDRTSESSPIDKINQFIEETSPQVVWLMGLESDVIYPLPNIQIVITKSLTELLEQPIYKKAAYMALHQTGLTLNRQSHR